MRLNREVKLYLGSIYIIAGFFVFGLLQRFPLPDFREILLWGFIATIVESLPVSRPLNLSSITVGFAVAMGTIVSGGPLLSFFAFAIAYIFRVIKRDDKYLHIFNTEFYKILFNIAQMTIMTGSMAFCYYYLGGVQGEFMVLPALVAGVLGVILNKSTMAGFQAFLTKRSFFKVWYESTQGIFLINSVQAFYGALIGSIYVYRPLSAILLFLSMFYFVRHSYKQYAIALDHHMVTMKLITKLVEAKDPYTSGHGSRVQELSGKLATSLDLGRHEVDKIERAAVLHDLGKIGVSDATLNKPGSLTKEEYEEIKLHPEIAAEIIEQVSFLKDCVEPILYHHERYDGTGYPSGRSGNEIPLEACIIAVADAYDAMTSDRPYRGALSKADALEEITNNKGTQFHPIVAEAFVNLISE